MRRGGCPPTLGREEAALSAPVLRARQVLTGEEGFPRFGGSDSPSHRGRTPKARTCVLAGSKPRAQGPPLRELGDSSATEEGAIRLDHVTPGRKRVSRIAPLSELSTVPGAEKLILGRLGDQFMHAVLMAKEAIALDRLQSFLQPETGCSFEIQIHRGPARL